MHRLALALLSAILLLVLVAPVYAVGCDGIALDDGCLFTATGSDTAEPDDGFAVTNDNDVPMWAFVRTKSLQAIGYPISQRWVDGPFTLQAFQKVILQWSPGENRMNYYNTLDALANKHPDVRLPNVPLHQVFYTAGLSFPEVTEVHLALLDDNPKIKAAFLAEPDWLNLFGLPIRYEEREVNGNPQGLQLLRAQRIVFEVWNVPAPGTSVGAVGRQNVPDKVKRLSNVIIPDAAKAPITASMVSNLPSHTLPTPTPEPTPDPEPTPEPTPAYTPLTLTGPRTLYATDRIECRPELRQFLWNIVGIQVTSFDLYTDLQTDLDIGAVFSIQTAGLADGVYLGPHRFKGKLALFSWERYRGNDFSLIKHEQHATGIPRDRTPYNARLTYRDGTVSFYVNGSLKHSEGGLPYTDDFALFIGCFSVTNEGSPHVTFSNLRVTGVGETFMSP